MVKVYVINHIYGNNYEKVSNNFSSMEDLIDWLLSDKWRFFYHSFTKGKTTFLIKNSYSNNVGCVRREHDKDVKDDFSFDISTYDHYGVYKKTISRIDVDGVCILHREYKDNKENVVVTNTCIKTLVEPMFEKWKKKQNIQYAD